MISIKGYNTFGVEAYARRFELLKSREEVVDFVNRVESEFVIIGGGSNLLFVSPVIDLGCRVEIVGIERVAEDEEYCRVEVGAGEVWSDFVDYCVDRNLGGVENLALIPGCVGAVPVQNIGAYGVEASGVIEEVCYVDVVDKRICRIAGSECEFGYRDSVFKNRLKNRAIVLSVTFRLSKKPAINIEYKDVAQFLADNNIADPTIKDVCESIKSIRRRKLPDTSELGSAGSFFKNPVITEPCYELLRSQYPDMKAHSVEGGCKISAAWLIEKAGLKGYRIGDAGVYDKHSLIIVNYGSATGEDICRLSDFVIETVDRVFGIVLEPEVIFVR